jgi:hypothetical protein
MNENHRATTHRRKPFVLTLSRAPFSLSHLRTTIIDTVIDDDARSTITNKTKMKMCSAWRAGGWALTWSIMDRGLQRRREEEEKEIFKEEKEAKKTEKMMPGLVVVDWMAAAKKVSRLTNSSQVSSRKPLFCRPLKFLSQMAGRDAMSVMSLSTSRLANAASELILSLLRFRFLAPLASYSFAI